jgi:hypothetical protein
MWNLEGLTVHGLYMDEFSISGKVRLSRVKFGGGVSHHIDLSEPVEIYGTVRESVILNHENVVKVESSA